MVSTMGSESPDNKSIRELRDELKDLNETFKRAIKSNNKISLVIIAFASIQVVIAALQFFVEVKQAEGLIIGRIIFFLLIIIIGLIFSSVIDQDKN